MHVKWRIKRENRSNDLSATVDFDGRPYNTLTLPCERLAVQSLNYGVK